MATLRVTNLRGRTANVAPDLPDGANITGVCTATSFVGSGAALTGIDATSIKDSGDTVRVQANTSGIEVTGVSTFSDSANFSSGATVTGNVIATSKFRGNDDVKLSLGDSEDLQIYHNGTHSYISDAGTGSLIILADDFYLQDTTTASMIQAIEGAQVQLHYNGNKKIETTNTGVTVTGTVAATNANITGITTASSFSDSDGSLRSLPVNSQTSAYTLVAADAGKLIKITTGGVTCPNGAGFSARDMISIMNESGSNQTITEAGGATLYWTADGSTGNRTLGARGVATIVMSGSSAFYISGSGLS